MVIFPNGWHTHLELNISNESCILLFVCGLHCSSAFPLNNVLKRCNTILLLYNRNLNRISSPNQRKMPSHVKIQLNQSHQTPYCADCMLPVRDTIAFVFPKSRKNPVLLGWCHTASALNAKRTSYQNPFAVESCLHSWNNFLHCKQVEAVKLVLSRSSNNFCFQGMGWSFIWEFIRNFLGLILVLKTIFPCTFLCND